MNGNEQRMLELMLPIEKQILMCDSDDDMLLIACAMLQRTREIFDQVLGDEGRKLMFKDLV